MPVISDDSDSSSDSVEDVLQKAVLNLEDSVKEKLQRRPKRMKRIDLDPTPIPANPNWFNASESRTLTGESTRPVDFSQTPTFRRFLDRNGISAGSDACAQAEAEPCTRVRPCGRG